MINEQEAPDHLVVIQIRDISARRRKKLAKLGREKYGFRKLHDFMHFLVDREIGILEKD